MMSIFSGFFGKSQRRDLGHANATYNAQLAKARDVGTGYIREGAKEAQGYLSPFAERGQQGFNLYADAIGAGGADARQAAFENFESDPFLERSNQNTANALRDVYRRYHGAGMGDSGASRLAVGRVAGEFSRQDVQNYLRHLAGLGQTGVGVAGSQAGIAQDEARQLTDLETSVRSALGNAAIGHGSAMASTRNIGLNNLLGLAGLGINAVGAYNQIPKRIG